MCCPRGGISTPGLARPGACRPIGVTGRGGHGPSPGCGGPASSAPHDDGDGPWASGYEGARRRGPTTGPESPRPAACWPGAAAELCSDCSAAPFKSPLPAAPLPGVHGGLGRRLASSAKTRRRARRGLHVPRGGAGLTVGAWSKLGPPPLQGLAGRCRGGSCRTGSLCAARVGGLRLLRLFGGGIVSVAPGGATGRGQLPAGAGRGEATQAGLRGEGRGARRA